MWFSAWWKAFGAGADLRICALWRAGQLEGLFPLYARGSRLHAMANEHTPVYKPFARSGPSLARTVEAALAVDLSEIVSAKTRRELGRLRNKMNREHQADFRMVRCPSELTRELQAGFEVEASGWKGRRGTAVLSTAATADFYRLIADAFHDEGNLRLSSISLDGKLVAFDRGNIDHNRLYGLKAGYDESFRRFGPGLVLQLGEIERCCELGLDAFELLGDAEEYKQRFSTSQRAHRSMRLYARRPLPIARYAYHRRVRPILKDASRRTRALRSHE